MKKFSVLKERIRLFSEFHKISMKEIYVKTGISDGTFSNSCGLNEDSLLKFSNHFNDLDANWLLTGTGSMIKEKNTISITEIASSLIVDDKYVIELQKKLILKLEKKILGLGSSC